MIDEYEFYHGAVLRQIVVESKNEITIRTDDQNGRIDSFVINGKIALHVKHSTKRMSPWQFTFNLQNIEELIALDQKCDAMFICLVCGDDGIVALTPDEFLEISGPAKSETYWIRLSRSKNKMFEVNGNDGTLTNKKARGLAEIVAKINAS